MYASARVYLKKLERVTKVIICGMFSKKKKKIIAPQAVLYYYCLIQEKEINLDVLSNGEWSGQSSKFKSNISSFKGIVRIVVFW